MGCAGSVAKRGPIPALIRFLLRSFSELAPCDIQNVYEFSPPPEWAFQAPELHAAPDLTSPEDAPLLRRWTRSLVQISHLGGAGVERPS